MKTRYDVTPVSDQSNVSGNLYPDVIMMPLDDLTITVTPKPYIMTQKDIDRFDCTVNIEYGSPQYDDLVLLFNGIGSIHAITVGQQLLFPDKSDLDTFLLRNMV
jgi:hypothetical protein